MSLAEISEFIKKVIKILGLLLALFIIFTIVKSPIKKSLATLFPPKNQPTLTFGKLEPLEFQEVVIPRSEPEFILNTTNGKLPEDIEAIVPVYKYKKPKVSYKSGENAQKYARELGFTDSMRVSKLSEDIFKWEDVSHGGKLEIDLKNNTIKLETPLSGLGSYFPTGYLNKTKTVKLAKNILISLDKYANTLYSSDSIKDVDVSFGKFRAGGLVKADSTLEAQIAKVDFFRRIDETPILGPDPKEGLLQVYIRKPNEEKPQLNFPVLQAYEWEIDTENSATYPLTPINQVWEKVKNNSGVITNISEKNYNPFTPTELKTSINKILVSKIYLAYYDTKEIQNHIQPIYVFDGNYTTSRGESGKVTIYYPAISTEYIELERN